MNIPYLTARLILTITAFFILNACKKSHTEDYNEYVVKEIVYDKSNRQTSFEYNDSWQLTKEVYSYEFRQGVMANTNTTYSYNSDGRVSGTEHFMSEPNYDYFQDVAYVYNSQGRLITKRTFDKETGVEIGIDEFVYGAQTITQTHKIGSADEYVCTYTLDVNGNIVKAEKDYASTNVYDYVEEWLDYDDKKFIVGPSAGDVTSKNNYRKYMYRVGQQPKSGINIKYTYNKAGYVTQFMQSRAVDNFVLETAKVTLIPKR